MHSILVDCKWNKWSDCNKSCGTGTQKRTIKTVAIHGGKSCEGISTRICNANSCPGKRIISFSLVSHRKNDRLERLHP